MSSDEQLVQLIEHYQKALLINPRSSVIHHQLAELYYQYGDLGKVIDFCQKALQMQPCSAETSETLSKVLVRLGFDQEEVQCLLEPFANTSTLEEAFMALGKVAEDSAGQDKHATKTWKEAVTSAYALAQQKMREDAFNACFKAIELEPSLSLPHFIVQYFVLPKIDALEPIAKFYLQAIQFSRIHRLAHTVLGDILTKQHKLPEAIHAYKNAWLESKHQASIEKQSEQRSTIDYLIIGIGKAGTSSLAHYLGQHPQIVNPHKKELLFFNQNFACGLDWYLAQFPPISFSKKTFLTGEATPWYLATLGAEERVFSMFPMIKLIAILRDPVARAISHYYMHLKMGLEHRSLENAIADEMAILGDAASLAQVSETYWKTERGYLWYSLYLPFLESWMSRFPKEQFLILNSEDLYNAPSNTLSRVFEFLNIPDFELISYSKLNLGSYKQVDDHSQKTLFDFFYVHNQKLEAYLGMEFGWNHKL